jgi:hypothetical protein
MAKAIVMTVDGSLVLGWPGPHARTARAGAAIANPPMSHRMI